MISKRSNKPGGQGETNNTIFVEGLSKVTKTQVLTDLFKNIPGCKDVRHIPEKQVAFVEFENDNQAGAAIQALNNYTIKESNGESTNLRISYAKRG